MTKFLTLFCISYLLSHGATAKDLVVLGDTVYPVSSPPIAEGVVVVRDGKIIAVGPTNTTPIPDDLPRVHAAIVTPGLIDAHSVIGMMGYQNLDHEKDQLETSEPIQPELRAIDGYDARERLISWVRGFGVTTIHTGHGPGTLISGQTLIAKTTGDSVEDAVIVPTAMIAASLGEGARGRNGGSPGTRSKAIAMLRAEFIKAQEHIRSQTNANEDAPAPDRNLRLEALAQVLNGEIPLLITAHRHQDISAALRLRDEFNIQIVLDGAAEAHLMLDDIQAANVPVIVHPPQQRPWGERENLAMDTPAKLVQAGITTGLQSGFEGYVPKTRVVLFEAAIAARYGLDFDATLRTITLDAARILAVDDRIGSLEIGKDGDLALFDGDPFEYTTHCTGVVVNGHHMPPNSPR